MYPGAPQGTQAQGLAEKLNDPIQLFLLDVKLTRQEIFKFRQNIWELAHFKPVFTPSRKTSRRFAKLDQEMFYKCAMNHYGTFEGRLVFLHTILTVFLGIQQGSSVSPG